MSYAAWSVVAGEQPSASKWNILGTNDAYFDSKIGTGTAWTTWTPTWTGLTIGNAVQASKYVQLGKLVICRLSLAWGSTTSAAGAWGTFTLPVTALTGSYTVHQALGYAYLEDAGVTGYHGFVTIQSTSSGTAATVQAFLANATYLSTGAIANTTPWTWGAGDFLTSTFVYEAA